MANPAIKREALVGLTLEEADNLKRVFGRVMGYLVEDIVNPAVHAFPELDPDDVTWIAVANARAAARGKQF